MELSRFEKARLIGARALQIKMGAPILVKVEEDLDALKVAKLEFEKGAIPLIVKRRSYK